MMDLSQRPKYDTAGLVLHAGCDRERRLGREREASRLSPSFVITPRPDQWGAVRDDYSAMEAVGNSPTCSPTPAYGRWLIIHGHKHHRRDPVNRQETESSARASCVLCAARASAGTCRIVASGRSDVRDKLSTSPRTWGLGVAARFTTCSVDAGRAGWEVASQSQQLAGKRWI